MADELLPHLDLEEINFLESRLNQSSVYLEFGAGGSTVLAGKSNTITKAVVVETDLDYLRKVRDLVPPEKFFFLFFDVGPTATWGKPKSRIKEETFHLYSRQAFQYLRDMKLSPDLIFIDGRFRVQTFARSYLSSKPGTRIIVDDFDDRPNYQAISTILKPAARIGTMAEFIVPRIKFRSLRALAVLRKYATRAA